MSKDNIVIELGDRVKDEITGLTGIVIARTKWLHGCDRLMIQPSELRDGKPQDFETFDEHRLSIVDHNAFLNVVPIPHDAANHIPLGDKVRDTFSGFEGIATARTTWAAGVVTYTVEADRLDNGKPLQTQAFDSYRLQSVKPAVIKPYQSLTSGKPGGPQRGESAATFRP